jgi:DNA repair protein RadC
MKTNYKPNLNRIKDLIAEDRPREKLIQKGLSSLSDPELIALLLSTGTREMSAVQLAREVLRETSGLLTLAACSPSELMKIKGIGAAKAVSIAAAFELGRRRQQLQHKPFKIINSASAGNYLMPRLQDFTHEVFFVLFLSRNHQVKSEKILSMGGTTATIVDVKMIFKEAVNQLASSILVAHNHPSGNLTPSQADREITFKIKETGKLLDIALIDHIIIGQDGYFSFADEGLI